MLEHPQPLSELCRSSSLLHLLILEDVPEDAELIALALEAAEVCFSYDVVDTEAAFQTALQQTRYSAVFSDYRLPCFNGLRAFERLQQSGQEIPFILITGSLGEEAAVECIKRGMTDYVLKDRLFRLPMVLERALQEFELRYQKQAAIAQLHQELAERKRIEAQLRHDAFHDALTNLPNRALFFDRLEHALNLIQRRTARHHADPYQFAVLFLDLDRFKVINDSLGHVVGDCLLKQVADRLSCCVRAGDTVARLGGDEFVILLEDIAGIHEAIEVAQRIHQHLRPPIVLDGHEVFISVSIGIALSSTNYSQASQLLRDADTAMYRAKSRGRGCHEVFDAPMHAQAMRRLQLENDLQRAIERQEFWLCYQPIVCLTTYQVHGFEALIRWQHPEQGLISPSEFVPIAEETGLILPIGLWVLQEACQQLQCWQKQMPDVLLTISVNLSAKQFSQPDLIPKIDQILQEAGLAGQHLKLEITESVLIENSKSAADILQQLQSRQIEICIDDFGTGYSSLSYLHRFPINTLKIDRSFVAQMEQAGNSEVVKAIIHLGLNLGLTVVAEGVETAEQVASLQNSGCHYGQGYWFTKADSLSQGNTALPSVLQRLSEDEHFVCCTHGIVPRRNVLYQVAV